MPHTFLLQPASWSVTGSYTAAENTFKVTGKSTVTHHENKWLIDSAMKLENGVAVQNDYEVVPFKGTNTSTPWTAMNPMLGKLIGTFTLQNNHIIESYHTEDQQFVGKEIMIMLDANHYTCEGTMYHQGKIKSSWTLDMIKIK